MILIVGCGFLGNHLLKHILSHTDEKVLATVRDIKNITPLHSVEYIRCNITNYDDVSELAEKCANESLTVFYFAASHNVDYVYANPDEARKVNIEALRLFFDTVPNIKKFFFSSTDCVYGEGDENKKFSEASPLKPVNEYGKQKLEAEKIVLSKGFTVVRFPFMLGPSITSKSHFYDVILSKLKSGNTIEMIDGMKRSVLSYNQAAELLYSLSILSIDIPQIINICSDTELSKYEIGCILAKNNNIPSAQVRRISEEEGKKFFKDKRASVTSMDNTLLKSLLKIKRIEWDELYLYGN